MTLQNHSLQSKCQTIEDLGWKVMSHPPYSSYISPSDYNLFMGLKDFIQGNFFKNAEVQKALDGYFEFEEKEFYWRGIHDLPDRWENVIAAKEIILIFK